MLIAIFPFHDKTWQCRAKRNWRGESEPCARKDLQWSPFTIRNSPPALKRKVRRWAQRSFYQGSIWNAIKENQGVHALLAGERARQWQSQQTYVIRLDFRRASPSLASGQNNTYAYILLPYTHTWSYKIYKLYTHQLSDTLTISLPVVFPPVSSRCASWTPSVVNGYSLKILIFNSPEVISPNIFWL